MLLYTLSRGLSAALPMGLDLTKNGMLPAWSTSLLRYGASLSTKNVSFLSPVQVSGKMTLPGGFKTLLAGLSSMRRVFSGVGHHPWGVPCSRGTPRHNLDRRTLRNCCPPPRPPNLGTGQTLLVEQLVAILLAEDEARAREITEEEVDDGLCVLHDHGAPHNDVS